MGLGVGQELVQGLIMCMFRIRFRGREVGSKVGFRVLIRGQIRSRLRIRFISWKVGGVKAKLLLGHRMSYKIWRLSKIFFHKIVNLRDKIVD